jgi:hypothetical protein
MDFALCPDDGPARLVRFSDVALGTLAILDKATNVLRVDRKIFDQLGDIEKQRVLTMHARYAEVKEITNGVAYGLRFVDEPFEFTLTQRGNYA